MDDSQQTDILWKIYTIATSVREEMVSIYGEDLAGYCIEASEKIEKKLKDQIGLDVKTVEGWCRFDDECYGSDRPWDPHTWVDVPSLNLYIDVTADQFNYGMATENEFPAIIVQEGLPHGMQYDEPSWSDFGYGDGLDETQDYTDASAALDPYEVGARLADKDLKPTISDQIESASSRSFKSASDVSTKGQVHEVEI